MAERPRLRSIPPRTRPLYPTMPHHAIPRPNIHAPLGGANNQTNPPSWQKGETNWRAVVQKENVFHKPPPNRPRAAETIDAERREIGLIIETMDDYPRGNLGVLLSFIGLDLNRADFRRGVGKYGPGSAVFYSLVGYNGKPAALVIGTFGDIFETQVVPQKFDENPFLRDVRVIEELAGCDPTSMKVSANGGIIIASYRKR